MYVDGTFNISASHLLAQAELDNDRSTQQLIEVHNHTGVTQALGDVKVEELSLVSQNAVVNPAMVSGTLGQQAPTVVGLHIVTSTAVDEEPRVSRFYCCCILVKYFVNEQSVSSFKTFYQRSCVWPKFLIVIRGSC